MPKTKIKHKHKQLYPKLKGGASSHPRLSSRNKSIPKKSKKKDTENDTEKQKQLFLQTLIKLITDKPQTNVKINYKNIQLNCMLGDNKLIVGNNENLCIEIKYVPRHNFCTLEGFFYIVSKGDCKSKSFLNNSRFMDNTKVNGRVPSNYNKKFNETMMELFDIININIGMTKCKLRDGSQIKKTKCGDISMTILKHFERGYGFYNEFGFMYKENIDQSNEILKKIKELKETSIDITNISVENINKLLESMGLKYEPVSEETIDIFKHIITANVDITYQQFINEIMNYCKMPPDTLPTGIFAGYRNDVITELKNLITIITHQLLGGNLYSLTQYKLYNKSNNGVSRLINKDNDETKRFEMVPMKKYNIEINNIVEEDGKIIYEINIE